MDRDSKVNVVVYDDVCVSSIPTEKIQTTLGESMKVIKEYIESNQLGDHCQFFVCEEGQKENNYIYRFFKDKVTTSGPYDEKETWELIR